MATAKETKAQLREYMKRLRDAIPENERAAKSEEIAGHLITADWYVKSKEILVYAAIRSEAKLCSFCDRAWRDGKQLYFPRVRGADMEFYRVDEVSQLAPGCFCVPEPADGLPVFADAAAPILVPGVAFSRIGARVGYGKGYYDRYLARHPRLFPVGICFEEQLVDGFTGERQDYPMRQIVTERGILWVDVQ